MKNVLNNVLNYGRFDVLNHDGIYSKIHLPQVNGNSCPLLRTAPTRYCDVEFISYRRHEKTADDKTNNTPK